MIICCFQVLVAIAMISQQTSVICILQVEAISSISPQKHTNHERGFLEPGNNASVTPQRFGAQSQTPMPQHTTTIGSPDGLSSAVRDREVLNT